MTCCKQYRVVINAAIGTAGDSRDFIIAAFRDKFMQASKQHPIAYWLLACCLMVLATLLVGGVTRLTRSGLSIVEWQPLLGVIPPLNESDWLAVFAKYQQSPEYLKVNLHMTLEEFKFIFRWEWAHRLLGRLIGVVFLVPFLWFWLRGQLSRALWPKLLGFFVLGGLQGAMGWYMVKSGLVDNPHVSQFRLAGHLGLAFLIFGLMLWTALGLLNGRSNAIAGSPLRKLQLVGMALVVLLFVMVMSGALVAGTHAGLIYNTFPLMGDSFVPPDLLALQPAWLNFFENLVTIQFDHRMIAWLLFFVTPLYCLSTVRIAPRARSSVLAVVAMLIIQITLGIATLLHAVPVALGAAHQVGAMILFGLLLRLNHVLRVVQTR
jgi:cytochrome c oxidase assembly protein subunit 15